MDDRDQELWLPRVTAGLCIFLFFFSLLVLSLFLLGNFQNFLDTTQTLLLRIFETSSLLYVVAALYNVILRIVLAIKKRVRWHTLPAVTTLLGAVFLFASYLAFGFLFAWLRPLN